MDEPPTVVEPVDPGPRDDSVAFPGDSGPGGSLGGGDHEEKPPRLDLRDRNRLERLLVAPVDKLQPLRALWRQGVNWARLVGWRRIDGPPMRRGPTVGPSSTRPDEVVPVVLCVWQRIDRLERTIALLRDQSGSRVELHIWNNNRKQQAEVDAIVANVSDLRITVTHCSRNIGGFGRFYLARQLANKHRYVIFIDDDQTFSRTMVSDLMAEARPHRISSHWAFRFSSRDDYWSRTPAGPGGRADYCATCGMVIDTQAFLDVALFNCPRRFWFVEDLWLSYYAAHLLKWELRKSHVTFEVDDDGRDQFLFLRNKKSAFLRHLVRSGWAVPARDASDS